MTIKGTVVKIFQIVGCMVTIKAERHKIARILRIIAKVIGILVAVFFLVLLIADAEATIRSQGFKGITSEWLFIIIPLVIALAAFIIAWIRELLGGILLLVAYLLLSFGPSVHSIFYSEEPSFYDGMFYFAAPFLVSGVFFIIASLIDKSESSLKREDITS